MDTVSTSGGTILVVGDFNKYLVVDRIGMQVSVIPTLFGTVNQFPTGESGFAAFWRTGGTTLVANAFRALKLS